MSEDPARVERDRQMLQEATARGTGPKFWAYTKLSGPGWLQSAITLGGGSLAGSLYLGVLAGYSLMWLQPLAMILGIIMLSAIGYVTLSTGERPFDAINKHVNPVLGWGWAVATLMANLVWCMPQFALGTAALRQNLMPETLGDAAMPGVTGNAIAVAMLFLVSAVVVWFYDSGGWGIKLFEGLLKLMVAVVVLCFFGVVVTLSLSDTGLAWGEVLKGFIPNPRMLYEPAESFSSALAGTGEFADFWRNRIVSDQQKVMITAAATAVGINMTFLLPYSMLARGWDRDFRGLAVFDLSTGLFIPFMLATSCVVIASASQFNATAAAGLMGELDPKTGALVLPAGNLDGGYVGIATARLGKSADEDFVKQLQDEQKKQVDLLKRQRSAQNDDAAFAQILVGRSANPEAAEITRAAMNDDKKFIKTALSSSYVRNGPLDRELRKLPEADRALAAMLVRRDAFNLAGALKPLVGKGISQYVFGVGVVGMAVSSIIILMLINGFVVCEMLGLKSTGMPHRLGCLMAAAVGATGPFVWSNSEAKFWLAVPTSMFGMVLLPIAYVTFWMMMNSKSLLGDNLPQGSKRLQWNLLMGIASGMAAFGSYWSIRSSAYPTVGACGLGAFILLAVVVHFARKGKSMS